MYIITTLGMACLCQLNLIRLQQFLNLNSLAQHQCCPLLITCSVEYFYPPTAIINFLILFSRSSLSEWNSKNVPLISSLPHTIWSSFHFGFFLSANDPMNQISSLHLHQTKSCCNYKSTYLFASNLSFAELNHFKLLSLFQFLQAHQFCWTFT